MSTLEFVSDPDLEKEFGSDLVTLLAESVEGNGDCLICGRRLGDSGRLRLLAQINDLSACVAAVHASCGGVGLTEVVISSPATWTAVVFAFPITLYKEQKSGLFSRSRVQAVTEHVPVVAVKPTCDVFTLYRDSNGRFQEPLAGFRDRGYTPLGGQLLLGVNTDSALDERPTITLAADLMQVTDNFENYSTESAPTVRELIREANGILVGITLSSLRELEGNLDNVLDVMHGQNSVFTWVPASEINGL
jgi:hypothetical protein